MTSEGIDDRRIRYGEGFLSQWKRGPDLSRIDQEELRKSQATLVFGQRNEPPGAPSTVALFGLSIAESFRDGD
jgi:F-type H+-transporting ATPase subunit beta